MRVKQYIIFLVMVFLLSTACKQDRVEISLAGEWEVMLDSLDKGIEEEWFNQPFADKIALPGTLCDAGYGIPCKLDSNSR